MKIEISDETRLQSPAETGVPRISMYQLEALAKAGVSTGGMFTIIMAMTRIKPGTTTADVPQDWVAKKTRQHQASVSTAFKTASSAGLIKRVQAHQPQRGLAAVWDFAPLLELHDDREAQG